MSPIRLGFVGLSNSGWASVALAPSVLASPLSKEYIITALSTTSAQSASSAAEKYSGLANRTVKPYHGDTSQIANDPDVDLVVVAVKTPDHKKAVIPAIESGKDVYVEWPLGNGLQEAIEIAQAARAKGVRTIVGTQSWQIPELRQIKEWISSGKIGCVLSSTFVASKPVEVQFWSPVTAVRDAYCVDPKNGATQIDIAMGHNLSAIIYALGPLASLSASTAQLFDTIQLVEPDGKSSGPPMKSPLPDQYAFSGVLKESGAMFTATWRGGIPATGEANKDRPTLTWIIDGDKGHIRVDCVGPAGSFIHVYGVQKLYLNGELITVPNEDGLSNVGRAFAEFAKGGGKGGYASFEDAVIVHKHIDAINRSAEEGRMVNLDL